MQGLATSIYLGTGSISALHTSPYLTSPYLTLPRLTSPNLVRPPTGPCDGCTSLSLNLTIPRVRIPEQINICECASSSHLLSVRPRVQSQRRQEPSSCNGGRRGSALHAGTSITRPVGRHVHAVTYANGALFILIRRSGIRHSSSGLNSQLNHVLPYPYEVMA